MADRRRTDSLQPTEDDEALLQRVRAGDTGCYAELWVRHRHAAEATARFLLRSPVDVDDVVAQAFADVLGAIQRGRGPHDHFRQYLMACVRNGCRVRQRTIPVGAASDRRFEQRAATASTEDPERYVDAEVIARAFSSLAPRWQQMLWATAVEQKTVSEVAGVLELSPNAAAALAHRAREAFATAYLDAHLADTSGKDCEWVGQHLAGFVRDQLTDARHLKVERHLPDCARCRRAVDELSDLNASLRSLLPVPAAIAAGGASTAASSAATTASTATGAGAGAALAGAPLGAIALKALVGAALFVPLLPQLADFDLGTIDALVDPTVVVAADVDELPELSSDRLVLDVDSLAIPTDSQRPATDAITPTVADDPTDADPAIDDALSAADDDADADAADGPPPAAGSPLADAATPDGPATPAAPVNAATPDAPAADAASPATAGATSPAVTSPTATAAPVAAPAATGGSPEPTPTTPAPTTPATTTPAPATTPATAPPTTADPALLEVDLNPILDAEVDIDLDDGPLLDVDLGLLGG